MHAFTRQTDDNRTGTFVDPSALYACATLGRIAGAARRLSAAVLMPLLFAVSPAVVASEPERLTVTGLQAEEVVELAASLIDAGELDQAEVLLDRIERDHPENEERAFLQGILALAREDYAAAERRFRAMLDRDPSLLRVRLELARTLFLRREDDGADYHFRLALARDPPAAVVENVNLFRAEIRRRRALHFNFGLGIAPDSNVNGASGKGRVDILGLPFELDEASRAHSGVGLALNADGSYRFRRFTSMPVYLGAYGRTLRYGDGDFNDAYLGLDAGPEFFTPLGRLRATATLFRRWYGEARYQDSLGARLLLESPITPRWSLATSLDLRDVDYPSRPWQDGSEINLAIDASRVLGPGSFGNLWAGGRRNTARNDAYASRALRIGAGISHEFGRGIGARFGAELAQTIYDEREPIFQRRRKDRGVLVSLWLLKRDWNFAGFAPSVRISYGLTKSTVDLYDSSRWRAEIGLARAF